jgi:hypothetical protein
MIGNAKESCACAKNREERVTPPLPTLLPCADVGTIRLAVAGDAERLAALAELKREQYRTHAPVFHRPKPGVRAAHAAFLASLIADEGTVTLVHGAEDGMWTGLSSALWCPLRRCTTPVD